MAVLNIDNNKVELVVRVGVLEKYEPDSEIEALYEEVQALRKRLESNAARIIGKTKTQQEAMEIISKDTKKREKWMSYVNKTYMKQLNAIQDKITEKNKKICPNFKEFLDNQKK